MDSTTLGKIVEGAPDPIIIQTEGEFAWMNPAGCRLFGIKTPGELEGTSLIDRVHPDYRKEVLRRIGRLNTDCKPVESMEYKIFGRNGEEFWVESKGEAIDYNGKSGGLLFMRDITPRREAEEAAERQLKLLSRSIEQSPVSIVITDIKGKIEYVNPIFETTSGYTISEIRGKSLKMLKSGFHSKDFYEDLWNTILSGKDWKGEFRNKTKSGEYYWNHAVISPILNPRGEVTNFVSVMEDITESKKMLEQLLEAKEKAEESNRLKTAFLANISHEIRTPMNGIMGFAEILKDPGLSRKNRLKFYDVIENSGKRMLDTVNDLIDISKIETGHVNLHLSETNVSDQLENLYHFFLPEIRKKGLELGLKNGITDKFLIVNTDRAKLNSILTNLIKNAAKFTDRGQIEFGCSKKENSLEFFVTDTGIGVPKNKQAAIFNRFEQAGIEDLRAFQGVGLGLSLSKSYVEMLGGNIWVESEEGQGSTFRFTIPLDGISRAKPGKRKTKVHKNRGIPQLNGKRILIAEDDVFSLEMLVYQLKKTGATLFIARDGREALEEFQKHQVDLVLLDIQMPEMNGYEVLNELQPLGTEIPFIAQTAYAMPEDIRSFQQAGFAGYLTKPVSQAKLFGMLDKYLSLHSTPGTNI
jgi:PAS domain S-box-containing protein